METRALMGPRPNRTDTAVAVFGTTEPLCSAKKSHTSLVRCHSLQSKNRMRNWGGWIFVFGATGAMTSWGNYPAVSFITIFSYQIVSQIRSGCLDLYISVAFYTPDIKFVCDSKLTFQIFVQKWRQNQITADSTNFTHSLLSYSLLC